MPKDAFANMQQVEKSSKDDMTYWNAFVAGYFSPRAVFRFTFATVEDGEPLEKHYEIGFSALPRYFHTHFDSGGVKSMRLVLGKSIADRAMPGDCHYIECAAANMMYWYENSHVRSTHHTARGCLSMANIPSGHCIGHAAGSI